MVTAAYEAGGDEPMCAGWIAKAWRPANLKPTYPTWPRTQRDIPGTRAPRQIVAVLGGDPGGLQYAAFVTSKANCSQYIVWARTRTKGGRRPSPSEEQGNAQQREYSAVKRAPSRGAFAVLHVEPPFAPSGVDAG